MFVEIKEEHARRTEQEQKLKLSISAIRTGITFQEKECKR
jgi:hypothetical protein